MPSVLIGVLLLLLVVLLLPAAAFLTGCLTAKRNPPGRYGRDVSNKQA
jgi:hypothetical protein